MRHYIDTAIEKSIGILKPLVLFLAGFTVIDIADFSIRVVTGVASIIISVLVIRHYRLKIALAKKRIGVEGPGVVQSNSGKRKIQKQWESATLTSS